MGRKIGKFTRPTPAAESGGGYFAGGDGTDDTSPARVAVTARPWFAKLMIVIALLVMMTALALIYIQWYKARFPTSYLIPFIPEHSRSLAGAEVFVRYRGQLVANVRLTEANKFSAPVLVEPDVTYTVTILFRDQVLMQDQPFAVPHRRGVHIPVTTQPAVEPSTRR